MAKTLTVEQLIAEYAEPLAKTVGIEITDHDRTPDGFALLLRNVADRLSPVDQTVDWLEDATRDLEAITHLGDDGEKTQNLLRQVDRTLYEAREELELV